MSEITNWIMVGLGGLGVVGSGALAMMSIGEHRQMVKTLQDARQEDKKEFQREIDALQARTSAAEAAAGAVKGLAQAVENMGREFALEVKHLVERVGLETGHIRDQLTDLKEEVRARAPRRRRQGED